MYTSFAVAGIGNLGTPIVKSLLEKGASVLVLTRESSDKKDVPAGAKVVGVDYGDGFSLTPLLSEHKVQVVIATFAPGTDPEIQVTLANAAKKAGAEVFVPAFFGSVDLGGRHSQITNKFLDKFRSTGIAVTVFHVGWFLEWLPWIATLGGDGKFYIVGKGDRPISWTALSDISGFVAHVFTTLPAESVKNVSFRTQGDRVSLNELGVRSGMEVLHVEALPEGMPHAYLRNLLMKAADEGRGSTGWDVATESDKPELAVRDHALWPDHKWVVAKDMYGY